jgi:diguanylate cyclase (GGDEF)-like protein
MTDRNSTPAARWDAALNIRTRLLVLLFVLALPFLLFLFFSASRQAAQERAHAGREMLAVARLTAGRLDDHVGQVEQLLSVLTHTLSSRVADAAANDLALRKLTSALPAHVSNVSVWTPQGLNIGSLRPGLREQGASPLKRKIFEDALHGKALAVEAPTATSFSGELLGMFAAPMKQGGVVVGVVIVLIQLQPLQSLLAPEGTLPSGAVVSVSDVSGVVLARSVDPEKWIGRNPLKTGEGGIAESLKRREGVRDGPSADGIDRIAGFTMASRVPWLVYVGVPADVPLAGVRRRLLDDVLVGALMLLAGLVIAARVAKGIAMPLRRLGEDAAAIGRGDLAHRSGVQVGGEIGMLAATLNRMADSLEQRTAGLKHLAEYDALTGVPNRALFLDRLEQAIVRSTRSRKPMALLFLDIDRFKSVNDTLGHAGGDELLKGFARVLQTSVRASDTVARLGGDEFTVILELLNERGDARALAQTIVSRTRELATLFDSSFKVSTSIGVALFDSGSTDAATLLRRADSALYEAKRLGRDRFVIDGEDIAASHSPTLNKRAIHVP